MMTRSLVIPIKPCSILLKFIPQYIVTLHLFYHYTSMITSLYQKLTNLEIISDYSLVNQLSHGLLLH